MLTGKVGVVGAGMMGAEIALCFAMNGFDVIMSDYNLEYAQKGKERQAKILDNSIKKGRLNADGKQPILDRILPTDNLAEMTDCNLIVEAVVEIFEVKSKVFMELDKICNTQCVFASNTSSISITKLASSVSKPRAQRFIGTHYFSPASVMKLVEVIPGILTSIETISFIKEVLQAIEKTPIEIKDVTGFAVNRLFHVFTAEACRLLEEGVATTEDIDTACVLGLGHPIGPFKLLDMTGHDLNIKVDQVLFEEYGERFRPSQYMKRMVDAGFYGKKTGRGFYTYD